MPQAEAGIAAGKRRQACLHHVGTARRGPPAQQQHRGKAQRNAGQEQAENKTQQLAEETANG
jgi:hypothetical protein